MGRGGGPSNRGGNRGRGGSMTNNRGGAGRGRGSNMYSGSRGGSQAGGQLKSHGSRGNFGGNRDYGNRDHGNRRGGSFVGGSHHQGAGGPSFRGRGQGHNYSHFSRGGRHDGGSGSFGSRDGSMASSGFLGSSGNGKKDENRRNFTDFKIVGLEIQDLSWTWGVIPASKSHIKAEPLTVAPSSSKDAISKSTSEPAKEESTDPPTSSIIDSRKDPDATVVKGESVSDSASLPKTPENHADPPETQSTVEMPAPTVIPPPPSRMRIYFHSPVTPDDSRPIPTGTSFSIIGSDETGSRRGKRKKLEDDDGDIEEGRAAPPPPGGSRPERSMSDDRFERASAAPSVEPSVAETASEGDWLMAAIEEDEGDGEDDGGELQLPGDDPISKDGSGYVAESEYGESEISLSDRWSLCRRWQRRAGIARMRRGP
ncbi:hypothetical protein BGW80DRAFT_674688 [Lactifluus volemus]|nr:hypothetical protein BGW80DRAFT_674688 [Lactifluus volemus]